MRSSTVELTEITAPFPGCGRYGLGEQILVKLDRAANNNSRSAAPGLDGRSSQLGPTAADPHLLVA